MGYLRRTSNYSKILELFDLAHIIKITDLVVISVETLRIDSGCSLKKESTQLIHINP